VAVLEFPAPVNADVPSVVDPSTKVTLPVGRLPETVAVKVTLLPSDEGLRFELTDALLATLTVCVSGDDPLATFTPSPE